MVPTIYIKKWVYFTHNFMIYFLQKHIFLVKPKLIVLMGATAMVDVLKINEPIAFYYLLNLDKSQCMRRAYANSYTDIS